MERLTRVLCQIADEFPLEQEPLGTLGATLGARAVFSDSRQGLNKILLVSGLAGSQQGFELSVHEKIGVAPNG